MKKRKNKKHNKSLTTKSNSRIEKMNQVTRNRRALVEIFIQEKCALKNAVGKFDKRSQQTYRSALTRFFDFIDATKTIRLRDGQEIIQFDSNRTPIPDNEINSQTVTDFLSKPISKKKKLTDGSIVEVNQQMAITTKQNYIAILKVFDRWIFEKSKIDPRYNYVFKGFAKDIDKPIDNRDFKREALNCNESRKLLASIDTSSPLGLRNKAMIALMLMCGLRTIEVSRATVKHFDSEKSLLKVHGKHRSGANDLVPLPSYVNRLINEYLKTRDDLSQDSPLFASLSSNCVGKKLSTVSISKIVKQALRKIGIDDEKYTAHSLRHTTATIAIETERLPLEKVSLLLRHRSMQTTLIYDNKHKATTNPTADIVAEQILGKDESGVSMQKHKNSSARHENHSLTR